LTAEFDFGEQIRENFEIRIRSNFVLDIRQSLQRRERERETTILTVIPKRSYFAKYFHHKVGSFIFSKVSFFNHKKRKRKKITPGKFEKRKRLISRTNPVTILPYFSMLHFECLLVHCTC
jgi:hypothetical protein